MDDTEMGRPARHARKPRRTEGAFLGNVLHKGEGTSVRVRGKRQCECGEEIKVDFTGPEDSLGVRLARGTLGEPKCLECVERDEVGLRHADGERKRVEELRERLRKSGLPTAWRTLNFDELTEHTGAAGQQREATYAARAWATGADSRGLLLHGEVGRGKTLIAAAATVARCAVSGVRWLPVAELLMDLRMPFDAPEYERAQRKLNPSHNVALVLDDLDKLKPTEHALQPLYVAINGWIDARQPLLVTCNRGLASMAQWMGDTFGSPIASRLAGYCEVIEIKGSDWRLS